MQSEDGLLSDPQLGGAAFHTAGLQDATKPTPTASPVPSVRESRGPGPYTVRLMDRDPCTRRCATRLMGSGLELETLQMSQMKRSRESRLSSRDLETGNLPELLLAPALLEIRTAGRWPSGWAVAPLFRTGRNST
ncbi:hypothetical protein CABS01_00859 [Colletotrichum abscissum]|uniref:Uncharacterized protein n=1 Tax=Colletotrichum abscissum TaxID=1671311 RepID=A0A9Q0B863_9PEZI|nr:uncharacterized protein CABS01_00859 [Colletotrichum abscissum]KAI3556728.1 hypothetical protein CABS02_03169 [Colletotrichum abscissum]KAK1505391.1 hypothetical protein CABS01_00859 [Colletotrichum abscissum]